MLSYSKLLNFNKRQNQNIFHDALFICAPGLGWISLSYLSVVVLEVVVVTLDGPFLI